MMTSFLIGQLKHGATHRHHIISSYPAKTIPEQKEKFVGD
jgi:hypothetical protein